MGNSINKIDEGFYICGVTALQPVGRLHDLGISCVLNAAGADLYESDPSAEGTTLADELQAFDVKIIGAEDALGCNIGQHFEEIADFIEAGRAKGGVVVHCAAGISRASTSACAYLMIKEGWSLEAAYARVRGVRHVCEPNESFWRQLRELEASILHQGAELKALPSDYEFPEQPQPPEQTQSKDQKIADIWSRIRSLDAAARTKPPEGAGSLVYLTATATPVEGYSPERLAKLVLMQSVEGITWARVAAQADHVEMRAGLTAPLDGEALRKVLSKNPMIKSVAIEGDRGGSDPESHPPALCARSARSSVFRARCRPKRVASGVRRMLSVKRARCDAGSGDHASAKGNPNYLLELARCRS